MMDKTVSDLCKQSLERKWFKESQFDILSGCPFCFDARSSTPNNGALGCPACKCPKEICRKSAGGGFIRQLIDNYGDDAMVCDISSQDLDHMIALFNKYIISETLPKV